MKRNFALIELNELGVYWFDTKDELKNAVQDFLPTQVIPLKYHEREDKYVIMEQRIW